MSYRVLLKIKNPTYSTLNLVKKKAISEGIINGRYFFFNT